MTPADKRSSNQKGGSGGRCRKTSGPKTSGLVSAANPIHNPRLWSRPAGRSTARPTSQIGYHCWNHKQVTSR